MGRPNNVTASVRPGKDTTVCDNLIGHPVPVRLDGPFNRCGRKKRSPQAGWAFSYGTSRPNLTDLRNPTRVRNTTVKPETANFSGSTGLISTFVQFPGFFNVRCSRRLRVTTPMTALTWHGNCSFQSVAPANTVLARFEKEVCFGILRKGGKTKL